MKTSHLKNSLMTLFALGITACGGGGNSDNDSNNESVSMLPIASNFLPVNNDIEVDIDEQVSAIFNKALFALTINESSVVLTKSFGDEVPLAIDFDEMTNSVHITPESNLALSTRYQVNLTTEITDLEGNALADTTWQFTTRDGNWGENEIVISDDSTDGFSSFVEATFDGNKNAQVVWSDQLGVLWANSHAFGEDWDTPVQIGLSNGHAVQPQLVNNNDRALVVWEEFDSNGSDIWSRQYTQNIGWGAPTILETASGSAGGVKIAADDNGNAIAVWSQQTNGVFRIWSNQFTVNSGWGMAQQIENVYTSSGATLPQIVMQANGNAMVVWAQSDIDVNGTTNNIWSARYSVNTGWELPEVVEINAAFFGASPEISMDGSGNVMMVWEKTDLRSQIWAKRYSIDSGWEQSQAIEQAPYTSQGAFAAKIEVNAQGDAVAVWKQVSASGLFDIRSNHYSVVDGWGTEQLIENNDSADANAVQISLDNEGNALAVFEIGGRIWANRYSATEGWKGVEQVDTDVFGASGYPKLTTNNAGEVMAFWTHSRISVIVSENVSNIRMNYFQ